MFFLSYAPYIGLVFIFVLSLVFCPYWYKVLLLFPKAFLYRILHKQQRRIYGVVAYVGGVGSGKTISMVREAQKLIKKYPDLIVFSNMSVSWANPINSISDVLALFECGKPVLICWDELLLDLNARDWSTTPLQLISMLCQNRKGAGVRLLYTAQSFEMVDKQIRLLTNSVFECHTILDVLTFCRKLIISENKVKPSLSCDVFYNVEWRLYYDTLEIVKGLACLFDRDKLNSKSVIKCKC